MTTSTGNAARAKQPQSTDLVAVVEESARDHHAPHTPAADLAAPTTKEPYAPPKQKLVTRANTEQQQCY